MVSCRHHRNNDVFDTSDLGADYAGMFAVESEGTIYPAGKLVPLELDRNGGPALWNLLFRCSEACHALPKLYLHMEFFAVLDMNVFPNEVERGAFQERCKFQFPFKVLP